MARHITSDQRALKISSAVFLVCLAVLAFLGTWWPGMALAIGITIATRQLLRGKYYSMALSLVVFTGIFLVYFFQFKAEIFLAVLFFVAGVAIFIKEFFTPKSSSEAAQDDNVQHEIEEEQSKE